MMSFQTSSIKTTHVILSLQWKIMLSYCSLIEKVQCSIPAALCSAEIRGDSSSDIVDNWKGTFTGAVIVVSVASVVSPAVLSAAVPSVESCCSAECCSAECCSAEISGTAAVIPLLQWKNMLFHGSLIKTVQCRFSASFRCAEISGDSSGNVVLLFIDRDSPMRLFCFLPLCWDKWWQQR